MPRSVLFNLTPDERGHVYPVYDTLYQGKHILTTIVIGHVKRGDANVAAAAQDTLDALAAHCDRHEGQLLFMEIAAVSTLALRLRKALEAANDKDAVCLIVPDVNVWNTVRAALNVDTGPLGTQH